VTGAAEYYKVAADGGHGNSQLMYGVLVECGNGVQTNYTLSAQCYKLAGDQGIEVARVRSGKMVDKGSGIVGDRDPAWRYSRMASDGTLPPGKRSRQSHQRSGREGPQIRGRSKDGKQLGWKERVRTAARRRSARREGRSENW
jgi:TPR repeat protein